MTTRITWGFDAASVITQFEIQRSSDVGVTFLALATLLFDPAGANFQVATRTFFYDDTTGAPGDIYRVVAVGAAGSSEPRFTVAPAAAAARCCVIGYIQNSLGEVDTAIAVRISTYGDKPGDHFAANPAGLVAWNPQALGIIQADQVVFPRASDGLWQAQLVRKTYACIQVLEMDFEFAFEVPDAEGPVNIRDIRQIRGADFYGLWAEQTGTPARITRG